MKKSFITSGPDVDDAKTWLGLFAGHIHHSAEFNITYYVAQISLTMRFVYNGVKHVKWATL